MHLYVVSEEKDCELFVVTYEDGEYKVTMVDKGVGPANLCVVHEDNRDIIVGANHTAASSNNLLCNRR